MENTKECRRCGFRKLLVIREFNQVDGQFPSTLDVWAGISPFLRAGKFRAIICCRCGHTEWKAYDIGAILQRIGELYPAVEVVNGELEDALRALGLSVSAQTGFDGWKLAAEGTHKDVALMVGERVHQRKTPVGYPSVLRIEIRATARAHLGSFSVRHSQALGIDSQIVYRQKVRTGDPAFDETFGVVQTGPEDPELAALGWRFDVPVIQIPWLNADIRAALMATSPEEVFVFGNGISILIVEYDPVSFPLAIDLAVRLARWNGAAEHPYR